MSRKIAAVARVTRRKTRMPVFCTTGKLPVSRIIRPPPMSRSPGNPVTNVRSQKPAPESSSRNPPHETRLTKPASRANAGEQDETEHGEQNPRQPGRERRRHDPLAADCARELDEQQKNH